MNTDINILPRRSEPITERCVAVLTERYLHCLEYRGRSTRWRWFVVESRPSAD